MNQKMEVLEGKSVDSLIDFMGGGKTPIEKAKIGASCLSTISRIKATERVQDATQYTVIRALARNQGDLAKYIAVSLPHLNPAKKLKGK